MAVAQQNLDLNLKNISPNIPRKQPVPFISSTRNLPAGCFPGGFLSSYGAGDHNCDRP